MIRLIFFFTLIFYFRVDAQLCSGTLGNPIFLDDFGSGASLYGSALTAGITNYTYQQGVPNNGTYVISNTANPSGTNGYLSQPDHTGNLNGYMMVVNSDYAASEVYRKNVVGLCPNTTYVFSSFLANNNTPAAANGNCGGNYIYANIKFQIEYPQSTIQGSVASGNLPLAANNNDLNWQQYGFVFTTGASQTSCSVVMINNAPGGCGNDYVVDDISLSPCGPGLALSVLPSNTVCAGQTAIFQSSFSVGSYSVPQYQWQFSSNGVNWVDIFGATSSNYSLTSTSFSNSGSYRLLAAEYGNILAANCRIVAGPLTLSVINSNLTVNSVTICPLQSSTLIASGLISYTWNTGATTNSIIVNPANSTTYNVYGANATCTASAVASVSVVTTSTISITGNTLICPGNTASLTATGASNYIWYPGGASGSTFITSPGSTTIYTIMGISSGVYSCSISSNATISVPPTLTLNVTVNSPTACVGNSITLTALNNGGIPGYTYTWTNGPVNSSYTFARPQGSYVYTVTSTDALGCIASKTTAVDFFNNPVLTSSNVSICPGFTGTLNVTGAATYTWYPSISTGSSFTASPVATTVYSVNGLSALGCSASATASMVVQPTPTLSFVTATITCANLGSATVTPTGGVGPFSYTWIPTAQTNSVATGLYPGNYTVSVFDNATGCSVNSFTNFVSLVPFTGTVVASDSLKCNSISTGTANMILSGGSGSQNYVWTNPQLTTQTTPLAVGLSAGIHTVFVSDGITFCSVTHTFAIEQPTPLSLNVVANPGLACVGTSVALTASNSGGNPGYSYTWTPGPVTSTRSVTEINGGLFVYTVQSEDAYGCSINNTVAVTFVDYPVMTVSNATICSGAYATLSVSGANSYTWSPGNFSGVNFYPAPTVNSSYTVIGNIQGCNDTLVTNVVVNPLPIPVISGATTVCQDQTINLSGSGGVAYNWAGPLFSGVITQNLVLNSVALNKSGVYSLTVTSVHGCKASTSFSVTVLPKPIVNVTGAAVCIGMSATLSASGGNSFVWSGPDNFSSNSSSVSIPTVSGNNSGVYTVVVTGANSCAASASVQLTGYPFPLPIPVISGPTVLCQNSSFTLQGSGGGVYSWAGPGGFNSTQQSPGLIASGVAMSGVYTLTVRNASNCVANTSASITVYPVPKANLFSSLSDACIPFCSNFNLTITSQVHPIANTSFYVNNAFIADSAFNFCFTNDGTYTIKSIITDINGCGNTNSLSVFARPLPKANFSYSPINPVENTDYVFFDDASEGDQINSWNWFFTTNKDSSSVKDPQYLYSGAGIFPVALSVKNKWGCADTIVKTIEIINDFSFYLPNSFTPNGDGINDIFLPKGVGIVKYTIEIFDRWGERIFGSDDFYKGWDGSFKGKECKTDIYVWKARVSNPAGKIIDYSGHVSIVEN